MIFPLSQTQTHWFHRNLMTKDLFGNRCHFFSKKVNNKIFYILYHINYFLYNINHLLLLLKKKTHLKTFYQTHPKHSYSSASKTKKSIILFPS